MVQGIKKRFLPITLILVTVFLISLVSIGFAESTSAPTVTAMTPADGASINGSSVPISVTVTDPDLLDGTSSYIKLNGNDVTSTFCYKGHSDPATTNWVVDSYAEATISGTATGVKEGLQTIEVGVKDQLGNTLTKTWTFTVLANANAPTLSNLQPAAGSKITTVSKISFSLQDSHEIDATSLAVSINGTNYPPTSVTFGELVVVTKDPSDCDSYLEEDLGPDYTKADVVVDFTGPIKDTNKVLVNVKDKLGNSKIQEWTFNGSEAPKIVPMLPSNGAILRTIAPIISGSITDNESINKVTMTVDGLEVTPQVATNDPKSAAVTYTPTTPLALGRHDVILQATDSVGNTTSSTWLFYIEFFDRTNSSDANLVTINFHDVAYNTLFISKSPDLATASIILDGAKVDAKISGIAPDYTLSYTPTSPLSAGNHSVVASVYDNSAQLIQTSWTLNVNSGPISSTPSPDSRVSSNQNSIYVNLGTTTSLQSSKIFFDGTLIPSQFTPYWTDRHGLDDDIIANLSATIPAGTTIGKHEINAVIDGIAHKWSFYYDNLPEVTFSPTPNTIFNTKNPGEITISLSDDSPVSKENATLFVDDKQENFSFTPGNTALSATLKYKLAQANEAYPNLKLRITDVSGYAYYNASYVINTYGGSFNINWNDPKVWADKANCKQCHSVHPGGDVDPDPGIGGSACWTCHIHNHSNDCGLCHDDPGPNPYPLPRHDEVLYQCVNCHASPAGVILPDYVNYIRKSTVPAHNLAEQHLSKTEFSTCTNCHSKYLWREHERYNKNGVQLNCDTCHKSTDPAVVNAIKNKQTDCASCHSSANHELLHNSGLDSNCLGCHKSTLSTDHIDNAAISKTDGNTCDTCHSSERVDVKRTIAAGNLNCGGCHNQVHNGSIKLQDSVPQDIPLDNRFLWTTPIDGKIFIGEIITPVGYDDGQVVISGRVKTVDTVDAWTYYEGEMAAKGWTLNGATKVSDTQKFSGEFTKNSRSVTVKGYNTTEYLSGIASTAGTKVEIFYK